MFQIKCHNLNNGFSLELMTIKNKTKAFPQNKVTVYTRLSYMEAYTLFKCKNSDDLRFVYGHTNPTEQVTLNFM